MFPTTSYFVRDPKPAHPKSMHKLELIQCFLHMGVLADSICIRASMRATATWPRAQIRYVMLEER